MEIPALSILQMMTLISSFAWFLAFLSSALLLINSLEGVPAAYMAVPFFFAIEVNSTEGAGPNSRGEGISLSFLTVCMFSHNMINQSFTCHEYLWTVIALHFLILVRCFNVINQFILVVGYIVALVAFQPLEPLHWGLVSSCT